MSTSSPAQLYCTLVGAVLVIAGIIGFFYSSSFDTGTRACSPTPTTLFGVLGVNGWHNVVHILLGLLGLACAAAYARSYALGVGLLYLVLALWGFAETDNVLLGLVPVNDEDNVLHLILGLTGLAAGAASPATRRPAGLSATWAGAPARPSGQVAQPALERRPQAVRAPAPAGLDHDQRRRGGAARRRPRPRAGPSCAGRAAPRARPR